MNFEDHDIRRIEEWLRETATFNSIEIKSQVSQKFHRILDEIADVISNSPYSKYESELKYRKKLELELKKYNVLVNDLKRDLQKANEKYTRYVEAKNREVNDAISENREIIMNYSTELSDVRRENEILHVNIKERDKLIEKHERRITNLKDLLDKKESELTTYSIAQEASRQTTEELELFRRENDLLNRKMNEMVLNRNREIVSWNNQVQLAIAESKDKVEALNKKVANLTTELDEANREISKLQNSTREARENSCCVIHEAKLLTKRVKELEEENKNLAVHIQTISGTAEGHKTKDITSHLQNSLQLRDNKGDASTQTTNQKVQHVLCNSATDDPSEHIKKQIHKLLEKRNIAFSNNDSIQDLLCTISCNLDKKDRVNKKLICEILTGQKLNDISDEQALKIITEMAFRLRSESRAKKKLNHVQLIVKAVRNIVRDYDDKELVTSLRSLFAK